MQTYIVRRRNVKNTSDIVVDQTTGLEFPAEGSIGQTTRIGADVGVPAEGRTVASAIVGSIVALILGEGIELDGGVGELVGAVCVEGFVVEDVDEHEGVSHRLMVHSKNKHLMVHH